MENYFLAGNVNVPDEKKDELNQDVMELFSKCGIRKTEDILLDERRFTVVDNVRPNKENILEFDYSIFEKKKRNGNYYDMNSCNLTTPDRGNNEFGLVMNCVMTLLESYTDGHCYLMKDNKPIDYIRGYLYLLHTTLDKVFTLNNRGRMWEEFLFFKNNNQYNEVEPQDIVLSAPWDFCFVKTQHLDALFDAVVTQIHNLADTEQLSREEIMDWDRLSIPKSYLFHTFQSFLLTQKKETEEFLKGLLQSDFNKRKEMAEENSAFVYIAEISLHVFPTFIVSAYSIAENKEFWTVWNELGLDTGYTDIIEKNKPREKKEVEKVLYFYEAILRENQDEFLEFWHGENLLLSENMRDHIEKWQEEYKTIEISPSMDVEKFLADILEDMEKLWKCRYVDKAFVTEFMKNKDNENYKKALVLLRNFMDKDFKFFPELSKRQAYKWVVKENRDESDKILMSALQSLMINHEQRKRVFGF